MNSPAGPSAPRSPIPVLRPQLPSAAAILPYLQRIDNSRTYSNWGPLVTELGNRIASALSLQPENEPVSCASSGMSALEAAILGTAGAASRERPLAIVADYTFTATGLAANRCGYELAIADARADDWMIHPDDLLARPDLLARTGLVIPVAPYGRPVAQATWQHFSERTGIPVVIDGAACFDVFLGNGHDGVGRLPVALSFHATKAFGTGEGGAVVCTDRALSRRIWQCLNFGFRDTRNSALHGINGKMSEYAAAVGLAEFDGWKDKLAALARCHDHYLQVFSGMGIALPVRCAPLTSACYVLLQCETRRQAALIVDALLEDQIDSRLWYGLGLGEHDVFRNAGRIAVAQGDALDPRLLLGLPVAPDLTLDQASRVGAAIRLALSR